MPRNVGFHRSMGVLAGRVRRKFKVRFPPTSSCGQAAKGPGQAASLVRCLDDARMPTPHVKLDALEAQVLSLQKPSGAMYKLTLCRKMVPSTFELCLMQTWRHDMQDCFEFEYPQADFGWISKHEFR